MNEELKNILVENECLLADGFDDCVLTYTVGYNTRAVYSTSRIILKLMNEGMDEETALEHFSYNIIGGIPSGDNAPVFIYDIAYD